MKSGELNNTAIREGLERRYSLNKKGLPVVLEERKQRVLAKSQKIRRYQDRTEQYKQNRMFQSNQKRLFEKIENMETDNTTTPDADESKAFWGNIWDNPVDYNSGADWLTEVEDRLSGVQKQNDIVITPAKVIKQLRKIANWKAPGSDGLQGFWLKSFSSCTERIALQLQDCLTTSQIPEWFTIGRTTLILKDKETLDQ